MSNLITFVANIEKGVPREESLLLCRTTREMSNLALNIFSKHFIGMQFQIVLSKLSLEYDGLFIKQAQRTAR